MAYKALYRTYRPICFEDVAGQSHIVKTLQNAIEQNKIAHAYLFCGPRGTGKTSIAKIFAKTVNCTGEKRPCRKCDNCLSMEQNNHPDIIEIDAASNNGVEEVRSLIEKVKYAPLKGKYKVYIIDEVHMMSPSAFNALLKTIEEPPAHVIFILATTEPHKVLPTIISRCQRFDFAKVPEKEMTQRIRYILDEEQIRCEDEVIRIVTQLADGGMRDALSIMDQCIAYAQNDIKAEHINAIYGITTIVEKLELYNHIVNKEITLLMNQITALFEKGIDVKRLTIDLIDLLKESILYEYTKTEDLLILMKKDEVEQMIETSKIEQRLRMIDVLMDTYDKYQTAASVNSYFEVALLKMVNSDVEVTVQKQEVKVNTPIQSLPKVEKKVVAKENTYVEPIKNVSRETFSLEPEYETDYEEVQEMELPVIETIENKSANPLDNEYILGLLVGAGKPEKAKDNESFKRLPEYLMEMEWIKVAGLLKNSSIVASGTNYMILAVDNQALANEINELDSKNELCAFTKELLGVHKKIFAISTDQRNKVIQLFKQRMAEHTLPEPIKIEKITLPKKDEKKELTEEEAVFELFGAENIIVMEE